jgi:hypothetical protein
VRAADCKEMTGKLRRVYPNFLWRIVYSALTARRADCVQPLRNLGVFRHKKGRLAPETVLQTFRDGFNDYFAGVVNNRQ